jgi:hypothetical protein
MKRRYAQGRERYVQIMLWKERAPAVGSFARVQILLDPRLNEDEPLHTDIDTP